MEKFSVNPTLLIIEDDDVLRKTLSEVFTKRGLNVLSAETGQGGIGLIKAHKVDVTLLDLRLPDTSGLTVLKSLQEIDDSIMTIVVTAYPEVKTAISAMKAGAYDYINKPFELEELKILVDKALETRRLRSEVERLRYEKGDQCPVEMIGVSPTLKKIRELIVKVAITPRTSVLIQGETGTGKELVANTIHCSSDRRDKPFIKVNCSAIPDNLLESELFGYEKGAFTDARHSKRGLFELADGGTIFLDEIGELKLDLQPKLLRLMDLQSFRRVGGTKDIQVDVRIITATNKDLESLVKKGQFREDLYYRLKVVVITVPPLRDRIEDVIPIAESFINKFNTMFNKNIKGISGDARGLLVNYKWPGNIRELRNVIERACILCSDDWIAPRHLPEELRGVEMRGYRVSPTQDNEYFSLEDLEKEHIFRVLTMAKWNKSKAAKMLGISRITLREKIKKYGLEAKDPDNNPTTLAEK